MNSVILMGRLVREPSINKSANGENIAKFALAVDRRGKDAGADFIGCVCFGKIADFAQEYLHQGTKVVVRGSIRTGSYQKQDGSKVYTTDVIVNECEFAESKKAEEEQQKAPAPEQNAFMPTDNLEDDGLPFN